jgi:hypothetical protein
VLPLPRRPLLSAMQDAQYVHFLLLLRSKDFVNSYIRERGKSNLAWPSTRPGRPI